MPQRVSHTFQARRALLRYLAPRYQQAPSVQKTLLLDSFVEGTGYSRKYAIALLNHEEYDQQTIQRRRLPQYRQEVQQALFLAWKATHYVCAKRLLPFLPSLVALLEGQGRLQLTEEKRRQLLAMSVSIAERFLRTQRKPCLHGLSTTTPGLLSKSQIPVRLFSSWEDDLPGFVEMDLVAHCGEHLDGSFLYTLTVTDLATGWTECIPLLEKSADAVLAGLAQARLLFPFPLLGLDTDSGSEFLNEELIAYCEREQLTFTRGRPGFKNDQCHVEQKNGAVVREAVGRARLVGVQAYQQLREVYRALRLVVNCFQPSLKLLAKVPKGEQVRLVYDVAQTPVQRLLASGVLSQSRQRELSKRIEQIDPLATRVSSLMSCGTRGSRGTHTTAADGTVEFVLPLLLFSLLACPLPVSEEGPVQAGHGEGSVSRDEIVNWPRPTYDPVASVWEKILALVQTHPEWKSTQILQEIGHQTPECVVSAPIETLMHGDGTIRPLLRADWQDPWPAELIQRDHPEPLPTEPYLLEEAVSEASQHPAQTQPMQVPAPGTSSSSTGEHEAGPLALTTLEQAMAAYVQEIRAYGRNPKTLQWHQTSLGALRRYLWRQFHHTDVCDLTSASLRTWLADLSIAPSARTGATRTVNTVAAYARSARAFCNWLVRQGYVSETLFPKDAVPKAQRGLPQPVEPEAFVHLLRACQLQGSRGGHNAGMTARNRAILWLLLDTGLQVSELCGLRLADVDRAGGTVTVRGKGEQTRTITLSADGQCAVCAYLDQARLTPAWEPAVPEARDRLLLTERRHPLTKNSLTLLFKRLSQRAGFTRWPICPSMLRDTYAIRFVQAGGGAGSLAGTTRGR